MKFKLRYVLTIAVIFLLGTSETGNTLSRKDKCLFSPPDSMSQEVLADIIHYCINTVSSYAFTLMLHLDKKHRIPVFYDMNQDMQDLAIILNGIDQAYIDEHFSKGSGLYEFATDIKLNNNKRLDELLKKYNVVLKSKNCTTLENVDGCYETARRQLNLPPLRQLKNRIIFKLR